MTEDELRSEVVREAKEWIGTPYISNGLIKGAGTDCAMLLIGVYRNTGYLPVDFDPRPYPAQWHVHQGEERYMNYVHKFADTVPGPPERLPKPGDIVMFKIGRVFAHAGIITVWPNIIHALGRDRVMAEDISKNTTGKRALWKVKQKFFALRLTNG